MAIPAAGHRSLRIETTAYGGVILPGSQKPPGLIGHVALGAGVLGMVVTGDASRSNYLWAGVGGMHFDESQGDRRPDMLMYNLVYGYRPKFLRKDYPHWDGGFVCGNERRILGSCFARRACASRHQWGTSFCRAHDALALQKLWHRRGPSVAYVSQHRPGI